MRMKRLLIVDNYVPILNRMKEMAHSVIEEMNREAVEILTANSGGEALRIIASTTIHLLITDYSMPGLTGLELISQIQNRFTKKMLMTFRELSPKDRQRLSQKGGDGFLMKPVSYDELKKVINRWL